jgi:EAL domain-containing protein (putative c-di-GMP-specific phosphodiesterase class I)
MLPTEFSVEHMTQAQTCVGCKDGAKLDFDFSMAFQPIVDTKAERVWGYEALVRGTGGESAWSVLSQVDAENRYKFDQACRVKAIETASRLFPRGEDVKLSINFMPNAVYEPAACLRTSLSAAKKANFPRENIMFEFTEGEKIDDVSHVERIVGEYKRQGFITAIDDFGAGYAGLNLLAKFQPDLIKVDMELVRDINKSPSRQVILAGIIWMARQLGVRVLAEGVESAAEFAVLHAAGVDLLQGYLFAKPAFEALPPVDLAFAEAA